MRRIRTVTGDFPTETLGHCQCHEHLFIAKGKSYEVNPALWMDDKDALLNELNIYKDAGGCSLVDAQPIGAGAMPMGLYNVSIASGVKIIASTGFHKLLFYPKEHWIFTTTEQQMTEYFIADIETGMALDADYASPKNRCSAKAGLIKTALDTDGLNDQYKNFLQQPQRQRLQQERR